MKKKPPPHYASHPPQRSALPSQPSHHPSLHFPPLLLTPLRSDYPRLVSLVGTLLGCSSPQPNLPPCCQCFSPITPVDILVGPDFAFYSRRILLPSLAPCLLFIPSHRGAAAFLSCALSISLSLVSIYLSICPSRHPIFGAWYPNRCPDIILLFLGRKYLITLEKRLLFPRLD